MRQGWGRVQVCAECGSQRAALGGQLSLASVLGRGLSASAAREGYAQPHPAFRMGSRDSVTHACQLACVRALVHVHVVCAYTRAPTPMSQNYIKKSGGEQLWRTPDVGL